MINFKQMFYFLLTIAVYGSNASANSPSEIKASELVELVGLPFAWQEKQAFQIHNTNSKGETVGTADFKNSIPGRGNAERIAWYWSAEDGFQIIATENDLLNAYGIDWKKVPFLFYSFVINESGVVAGSFVTGKWEKFPQCSWLWWSLEHGIHLSAIPDQDCYQIVKDIDNSGRVLLNRPDGYAIANISSMDDLEVFDFPINEFNVAIKNWLINFCCNHHVEDVGRLVSVKESEFLNIRYFSKSHPYQPMVWVLSWTEDGGIQGMGSGHCILRYNNMGNNFAWPKGGVLITFTFTINSQGLYITIKEK